MRIRLAWPVGLADAESDGRAAERAVDGVRAIGPRPDRVLPRAARRSCPLLVPADGYDLRYAALQHRHQAVRPGYAVRRTPDRGPGLLDDEGERSASDVEGAIGG